MLPSDELALIVKKQMLITEEEVFNLFYQFVKKSPVDTGSFRAAWAIDRNLDGSWTISNDVEYATILFDGRQSIGGRFYGSEQWKEGGHGMLEKFNIELQQRLDDIRV